MKISWEFSVYLYNLFIFVFATDVTGVRVRYKSEEERLLNSFFKRYNRVARPVINSSKTVPVKLQFSLLHIQELDMRSQILTAAGLLILEWSDERLQWRLNDYNVREIILEAKLIWVPSFALVNGADQIHNNFKDFRAIVSHTGRIRWEPGGIFRTMCAIDITYFPFDDQTCSLVFRAWSYDTYKVNLTITSTNVNLDSYRRNGEWKIMTTEAMKSEFFHNSTSDERFSKVAFMLGMRRRHTFYVMNVILPSMVTSVLLLSIFYCPPGQKVQIGVVVLLSFRIFLLNVTDSIPQTSDHIPLLGIYLACTMSVTTMSMILTVLVLNLHEMRDTPVPRWMRIIFLGSVPNKTDKTHKSEIRCFTPSDITNSSNVGNTLTPNGFETNGVVKPNGDTAFVRGHNRPIRDRRRATSCGLEGYIADNFAQLDVDAESRFFHADMYPHECRTEKECANSYDWQKIATVVDKFLFWTFLAAQIAMSLYLFHPLLRKDKYNYQEL